MFKDIVSFIQTHTSMLDLIIDNIPLPIFIKDLSGRYIGCNQAFLIHFSISREELLGKTVYDLWRKEEADIFHAKDQELFTHGGVQIYETQVTTQGNQSYTVQFQKKVFYDDQGKVIGFLGVIIDMTDIRRLEDELKNLANTDELTKIPNRREGFVQLEILHADSKRKNRIYCMAILDLDHFKGINDHYGHNIGDQFLREFGDFLKKMLRISDICFRYGGEEFVVLLPETKKNEGLLVLDRIREAWSRLTIHVNSELTLSSTVSIGLIESNPSETYDKLIIKCDKALYQAKSNGRNRIVCV